MAEAELEENLDRTFKSLLRAHDEVRSRAGGPEWAGKQGRWPALVSGIGILIPPVTLRGKSYKPVETEIKELL